MISGGGPQLGGLTLLQGDVVEVHTSGGQTDLGLHLPLLGAVLGGGSLQVSSHDSVGGQLVRRPGVEGQRLLFGGLRQLLGFSDGCSEGTIGRLVEEVHLLEAGRRFLSHQSRSPQQANNKRTPKIPKNTTSANTHTLSPAIVLCFFGGGSLGCRLSTIIGGAFFFFLSPLRPAACTLAPGLGSARGLGHLRLAPFILEFKKIFCIASNLVPITW